METFSGGCHGGGGCNVYSEVEPFEGWKPIGVVNDVQGQAESIARLNPLRDGNSVVLDAVFSQLGVSIARLNPLRDGNFIRFFGLSCSALVYSEVEPFEGWKHMGHNQRRRKRVGL